MQQNPKDEQNSISLTTLFIGVLLLNFTICCSFNKNIKIVNIKLPYSTTFDFKTIAKINVRINLDSIQKKCTGFYVSYPFQEKSLSCYYINHYKNGVKHGKFYRICNDSYGNTSFIREGNYVDGKIEGKVFFYYQGELRAIGRYSNDSLIKMRGIDYFRR